MYLLKNIQQIPTPIFYLGGRHGFSAITDGAGAGFSIVSATAFAFGAVADSAGAAFSIVSATINVNFRITLTGDFRITETNYYRIIN